MSEEKRLEFRRLVSEMRRLQKEYFRTRNMAVLEQSKVAEKAVDKALRDDGQMELFP
jgi:hypothetical protein